jgi:nucleotide-binding universal stress UspA family protein
MITNRRVVVGIGPSRPRPELVLWAAMEAQARHARLELVTASPAGSSVADATLRWAATAATEHRPDLTVVTRSIAGRPEQVLATEARGAELLVIGAGEQSPFAEAITGSVPAALLTTSPCPIVVVPKEATPAEATTPVLVGVDTTETSRAALDYAFGAASLRGTGLAVVLCWAPPRDRAERNAERLDQHRGLAESLAGFAAEYPEVPVTEYLVDGDPIEELARRSRHASLLVLGSRGRGRLASMAFGSVSRTLIRRSHCPVAVLRPDLPIPAGAAAS